MLLCFMELYNCFVCVCVFLFLSFVSVSLLFFSVLFFCLFVFVYCFLISNKLDLINFHKADGRLMQKANALVSLVICLLSLLDMAA